MEKHNIDPGEVAYYESMAGQWWDRQGKFWPLHRLNELRTGYLKEAICHHFGRDPTSATPLSGLNIIDVGCGGGILSESMAQLGANLHGIDVVEKSINIARRHSEQMGLSINYESVSVEEVVARCSRYDVILNMEVVEHVADLPRFMSSCSQLLSQNGIMFIATINRNLISWIVAIVGAEYILRWLPKGTHSWGKFVRPAELISLLSREGLTVTSSSGVRINPFTKSFSLSKRPVVNYMLAASRDKAHPD